MTKRAERSDKSMKRPGAPIGPLQAAVLKMIANEAKSVKQLVEELGKTDRHVVESEMFNLVKRLSDRGFVKIERQIKLPSMPGNKPRSYFIATEAGRNYDGDVVNLTKYRVEI